MSSLFARTDSLFQNVGNFGVTSRKHCENPGTDSSTSTGTEEIPCIFPSFQGIVLRDQYGRDSPHLLGVRFGDVTPS